MSDSGKRQTYDLQRKDTGNVTTAPPKTPSAQANERTGSFTPFNTQFSEKFKSNANGSNNARTDDKPKAQANFRSQASDNRPFKDFDKRKSAFDNETESDDEDDYFSELLKNRTNFKSSCKTRPTWNNKWSFEADSFKRATEFNDILEEYYMYKMFKDISTNMFNTDSKDRLLFNLTYIIAELNKLMGRDVFSTDTMFNDASRTSGFNRMPKASQTRKPKSDTWEFDWLGKPTNSFKADYGVSDEESDAGDTYERSLFCQYCTRQLSDEDSLIKHETICKKLSHNQNKPPHIYHSRFDKIIKCQLCKADLDSYEYLTHNCTSFVDDEDVKMPSDYFSYKPSQTSSRFANSSNKYTSNFYSSSGLKGSSSFRSTWKPTITRTHTTLRREKMKYDTPLR